MKSISMETINDRIEQVVNERFGGNKAAFAKSIGLPPTGLSNYLGKKRRSKSSVDMVAKIVLNLGVDARWLLLGERALQAVTITNSPHSQINGEGAPPTTRTTSRPTPSFKSACAC